MEKNKIILEKANNDGYRYEYKFKKEELFKKFFIQLMSLLGFDEKKIWNCFVFKNGKRQPRYLKINNIKDKCNFLENENYEVDVFYGIKSIIMVVRVKNKNEEKKNILVNSITSLFKWVKPLKLTKIKRK